jgi:hypothetical protein
MSLPSRQPNYQHEKGKEIEGQAKTPSQTGCQSDRARGGGKGYFGGKLANRKH